MGEKVTYDSSIKTIIVNEAPVWNGSNWIVEIDVKVDIFSDGKEDWLADNTLSKFKFPVATAGGDDLPGVKKLGATFFLEYGWKIRPYEDDHVLSINGNIYSRDGSSPFTNTLGSYNIMIINTVSNLVDSTVQQLTEIEFSTYQNAVWVKEGSGNHYGDFSLVGNREYPVEDISDAVMIANERGLGRIGLLSDYVLGLGEDITGFEVFGENPIKTVFFLGTDGIIGNGTVIRYCFVGGTIDDEVIIRECIVSGLNWISGYLYDCVIYGGTIHIIENATAYVYNCKAGAYETGIPTFDLNGSGQSLSVQGYGGRVKIQNKTGTETIVCNVSEGGEVTLDSTVTNGTVIVAGIATIIDNSTGTTVVNTDALLNRKLIAETISTTYSYEHRIYIDVINGTSGTESPQGMLRHPVDNLADALIIAVRENIDILDIKTTLDIVSGDDVSGYTIIADRSTGNVVTVESGAITNGTYFENLTISGTMNGTVRYTTCVLGAINNFDGGAKNCLLTGNITMTGAGSNYLTDCDVYMTDPNVLKEIDIDGHTLNLIRCRGGFKITNKTSTDTLAIDLVAGVVEVASDCVAGSVFISGIAEVTDNSAAGCNVMIKSMSHEAISQNVWDEPLTASTHNLPTTAGRRVRTLTSAIIRNERARGSGIGDNQIELDDDASTVDGAYDPASLSIIGGTGLGQTRNILDYVGATRIATVDRNWRINPDTTSEFVIVSNAGREHVNEGLAQGGDTDSIILNQWASPTDNAYVGQVIFIRSGTGEDQACRCRSYDGTTKEAIICSDWPLAPDDTSGYVILPTGTIKKESIGEAVWSYPDAISIINEVAFIKQTESGKWHITGNQMIFYEDDNITEIMRFNLFDKDGNPADENVFRREKV